MSTSTKSVVEPTNDQREGGVRSRIPKKLGTNVVVWLILGLAAITFVGLIAMIIGGLFLASGSREAIGENAVAVVTEDAPADVVVETFAPAPEPVQTLLTFEDPADLLVAFASNWTAGDFSAMQDFVSDEAIAVAQEWDKGGEALISEENVDDIVSNCNTDGSCQFLYAPPEGFGLIFDVTFTTTDNGLLITKLVFGGDAG